MWDSLHLFSPADHSSLPGRLVLAQPGETYPGAGHVVAHLFSVKFSVLNWSGQCGPRRWAAVLTLLRRRNGAGSRRRRN